MSNSSKTKLKNRKPYSEEYRAEALKLANSLGVSAAAKELGLHNSQIYAWRSKNQRDESTSDAESRLLDENIALKRRLAESKQELEFLKKASAYFAKNQK